METGNRAFQSDFCHILTKQKYIYIRYKEHSSRLWSRLAFVLFQTLKKSEQIIKVFAIS